MRELAWVVSSIVQEVRNQDIEDNTLIVFTSDNGPQLEYCEEGGDPGIFRGGKTNSFEGGYRVPLISYWPGVIEPVRFGDYKVHFFTQDDRPSQYFGRLCQPFVYPMTIFFYCDEKDVSLECVHYHDPPLIFNLQADPTESYMLDASLYTELLDRIQNLVKNHERTIVRAPPLMDENSDDTTPCCNIIEECICNWP
ncbi:putative arylsulfatase-like [Apostichopus japonicus]|uniref:Putative arylsulfatase-like n=1 Tax=Stichopus japonicus TaxID=307972 RepID=A0A2G8KQU4_STIJA|nr:putative arylsulfatase-like [Apostichopus japonicus]